MDFSILDHFYQELLKEKSNPQLKGNRKGIIVKDKEAKCALSLSP